MKAPLESLVLTSIVAKLHHFSKPSTASEPVVKRPRVRGTRIGLDEAFTTCKEGEKSDSKG